MVGPWEWVLIVVLVLVVFGAKRIPEIGRNLGKGIKSFKTGLKDGEGNDESPDNPQEQSKS